MTEKAKIVHSFASYEHIDPYILARDKLKWAFKLYDRDGSGSITKDEMEDIFRKLCL